MARGLSTTLKTALASNNFIFADLVELDFDTPLFYTSAGYDLSVSTDTSGGTQTYYGQGQFMSHNAIQEREDPSINTLAITFEGVTATFRDIATSDDFLHKDIRIYKALFDNTDLSVIDTPILWYTGKFTGASINEDASTSTVVFSTSNYFADFDQTTGRKSNDGSQQRFYPGDRFFQYSTEAIADIKWGRK